jgi:hypothetical protein
MSDLKREILAILAEDWADERKADAIVREAQDHFQPYDAEMWDS